jgi:hypothetical protein
MESGKRKTSLQNLLQAFGIRSEIIEDDVKRVTPLSFAIAASSSRGIALAYEIQQLAPKCPCVFLINTKSALTPAAIEARIRNPLFIIQPVTV